MFKMPKNIWFLIRNKYFNFSTGEIETTRPNGTVIENPKLNPVSLYYGGYITTDENNNLVLVCAAINIASPVKGERIREWDILATYTYNSKRNCISFTKSSSSDKRLLSSLSNVINNDPSSDDYYMNSVLKVYNTEFYIAAGNKFSSFYNPENLFNFLTCFWIDVDKKDGKKQRLIDELSALTPEITSLPHIESYKRDAYSFDDNNYGFAIVSRIEGYKEPCCVIRTFTLSDRTKRFYEGNRMYVTKSNFVIAKKRNCGDYVTTSDQKTTNWTYPLVDIESSACKGTMIEYFASIVDDIEVSYRTAFVSLMCSQPIVEKLYKAGYKNLALLPLTAKGNLACVTKQYYGEMNKKEKSLNKIIGANNFQLAHIDNLVSPLTYKFLTTEETPIYSKEDISKAWTYAYVLPKLKDIYPNLSFLDNDSFTGLYELASETLGFAWVGALKDILNVWPLAIVLDKKDMLLKIIKNTEEFEYSNYYAPAVHLLWELTFILPRVDISVPFNFKNYDDLRRIHDEVSVLYEVRGDEMQIKKFQEAIKHTEQYAYESGDYCVVVPKVPEDVVTEGITLHHCVKTYIDAIANCETEVVFIREKDNIEIPFYTAEIRDKKIRQVHGMCNCNVSKSSDLYAFIMTWAKNKRLSLKSIDSCLRA